MQNIIHNNQKVNYKAKVVQGMSHEYTNKNLVINTQIRIPLNESIKIWQIHIIKT